MKRLHQVNAEFIVAHVDKSVIGGCALSAPPKRCFGNNGGFYTGLRYNISDARKVLKRSSAHQS